MTAQEVSESNTASTPSVVKPKQVVTHWRTAAERAQGIRSKKLRRRAAHRVALNRSHANG